MYVYRIIVESTNECLPEPYFDKVKAIEDAKAMKKKSKDKLDFKVVSLVPLFSTKEQEKQNEIDF